MPFASCLVEFLTFDRKFLSFLRSVFPFASDRGMASVSFAICKWYFHNQSSFGFQEDAKPMQRMEFPLVLVFPVCFRTRNATSAGGIRFRFLFPVYFRFLLILFLLAPFFHLFFLHRSYRSARRGCILNLISERSLLEINLRNSDLIPYFGELPWVTPLLCFHYIT